MANKKTHKVEFGNVLFYFTPTEPDEWQYHDGYDFHYDEDDNTISVYRIDDVYQQPNYSKAVHVQSIK